MGNANELCNDCPRRCNVDRSTRRGYCRTSNTVKVARAALHMWEEPCISGENGSGAIFFSGCNMQCVFCQNKEIASGEIGKEISIDRLAEIMIELQEKSANNINLVTPSHYVNQIVEAIKLAKTQGLNIPIVYNTSAYETEENLKKLEGYVDVYLPDCKYYDDELAISYSKAPRYHDIAVNAIAEMLRQTGKAVFDDNNLIKRGVIVRHMVMPGHTKDSKAVIKALLDKFGTDIYVSIMSQYTPLKQVENCPELNRKITTREYEKVLSYALNIGLVNGFFQDMDVAEESFIPLFDLEGV